MMDTIRDVTYDGEDYEITFNGAHGNGDWDLLGVSEEERIHQKRSAPKLPPKTTVERLRRVMPETETRDGVIRSVLHTSQLTVSEILEVVGCKDYQVRTTLARLKRAGMLRWDRVQIRHGRSWWPARRYWMVSQDDA